MSSVVSLYLLTRRIELRPWFALDQNITHMATKSRTLVLLALETRFWSHARSSC